MLDIQADRYIQYQWEERPGKQQVNKAINNPDSDFDDWFTENHVVCPACHDRLQEVIEGNL